MAKSYADKLLDRRWIRKRNQILHRDDYTCRGCGAPDQLHVHHCYYRGEPWDVKDEFLLTLCENCHAERQELEDGLRLLIGQLSSSIKQADIERFKARFSRLVFEFSSEVEKFGQLVYQIKEGNRVG